MQDYPDAESIFNFNDSSSFREKFQLLLKKEEVSDTGFSTFSSLYPFVKPIVDLLSNVGLCEELYSGVRLSKYHDFGRENIALSVELFDKKWLQNHASEEEPNMFSMDIVLVPKDKATFMKNIPKDIFQAKSHWCTRMDQDDKLVTDPIIKDIDTILQGMTDLCREHNGFVTGTDLLHCVFTIPSSEHYVAITVTSEKVIII